jgi:hypothetical protein
MIQILPEWRTVHEGNKHDTKIGYSWSRGR